MRGCKWILLSLTALLVGGFIVGEFLLWAHFRPRDLRTVREVETRIHLILPPSTRLIRARIWPGLSTRVLAVVEMDRRDLDALLASDAFHDSVTTTDRLLSWQGVLRPEKDFPEWQPELDRSFVSATCYVFPHSPNQVVLQAAQGRSSPVRVYLAYVE